MNNNTPLNPSPLKTSIASPFVSHSTKRFKRDSSPSSPPSDTDISPSKINPKSAINPNSNHKNSSRRGSNVYSGSKHKSNSNTPTPIKKPAHKFKIYSDETYFRKSVFDGKENSKTKITPELEKRILRELKVNYGCTVEEKGNERKEKDLRKEMSEIKRESGKILDTEKKKSPDC